MAKGRASGGWFAAGTIVLIVLVSTGTWNPFPALWKRLNVNAPVSDPAPAWQQRIGDTPDRVTLTDHAVIVQHGDTVEGRGIGSGGALWTRKADWSAVTGTGEQAAVVTGRLLVKGYDVLNPRTGTVIRHDDRAVAVWTFAGTMLDVRCAGTRDCTLRAWEPRGGAPLWSVPLPGIGFVLLADNPGLLGVRRLGTRGVDDGAGGPRPMPQLLGFPINGRIDVVDTAAGRLRTEIDKPRTERISLAGGRILRISATSADGTCYFTVSARDPVTGRQVWRRTGINLRTAEGTGCAQRHDPAGQGDVLLGVGADGRETLLDAGDGRVLWRAGAGEKVLSVSGRYAVIRSADGGTLKMISYAGGQRWTRQVHKGAQAAITPYAVVVIDHQPDRVIALDPGTGRALADVRTSGTVRAVGAHGLILSEMREIGYVTFGRPGAAGPADRAGGPTPGAHDRARRVGNE